MAITEDEAGRLISTIVEAISSSERPERLAISELISQWRAEIEAGRPVDRRLNVRQSPGLDEVAGVPRSGTSSSGEFVGKKDYTKVEQLNLLLEALGLAFVAPQMMASNFLDAIERCRSLPEGVADAPFSVSLASSGGVEAKTLQIDRNTVTQSVEATAPLATLLKELSQEDGLRTRTFTRPQDAN